MSTTHIGQANEKGWRASARLFGAAVALSGSMAIGSSLAEEGYPEPPEKIDPNPAQALETVEGKLKQRSIEEVSFITVTTPTGETVTFAAEVAAGQEFTLDVSNEEIKVPVRGTDGTGTLQPLDPGARVMIIHNPLVQCNPNLGGSRNCTGG